MLRPRYPMLFLLALVGSCLLWYGVAAPSRERISVRSVKAPLTLVNIPPDLELVSPVPEPVTVQLRGPLSQTLTAESAIEVLLDLAQAGPGTESYTINPDDIPVPPEVTVISVEPREITLELERLEVASFPVKPVLEGEPAPGFVIGDVRVMPPQVRLQGPRSKLELLTQVETYPVVVEGADTQIEATVQLSVPRPLRSLAGGPVLVVVSVLPAPTPTPTGSPGNRRRSH